MAARRYSVRNWIPQLPESFRRSGVKGPLFQGFADSAAVVQTL